MWGACHEFQGTTYMPWYIDFNTHIVPHFTAGLDIKHLAYMPVGHVGLKIYMPCKNFYVPSQYLYKPCKAYVYCWENKYMPRLKNHLPSWAHNHKSLGALGQDLRAPGMRAYLNVEPCSLCYWEPTLVLSTVVGKVLSSTELQS